MAALIVLAMFLGVIFVLPLLLLKAVIHLAVALVLLPLRIVGLAIRIVGGAVGVVGGVVGAGIGILAAVAGLLAAVVLAPLFPLLLLGAFVWVVVKALQPAPIRF